MSTQHTSFGGTRTNLWVLCALLGQAATALTAPPSPAPTTTPTTAVGPAAQAPASSQPSGPRPRISLGSCNVEGRLVALTFDDGPDAEVSPKLLEVLKKHEVHATFFVVGKHLAEHPELVKRMAAEGHEVGNHSWKHSRAPTMERAALKEDLQRTSQAIAAATGQAPTLFRPPGLATDAAIVDFVYDQLGLKTIRASAYANDPPPTDPKVVHERVMTSVRPGAIILCHERSWTAEALDGILTDLKAQGYTLVTVSELIAQDRPK